MDNVIPRKDRSGLAVVASAAALLLCFRAASNLIRKLVIAQMNNDVNKNLCLPFLHHAIHLPLSYFDQRLTGDTFSRANDVTRISSAVTGAVVTAIPDFFFMAVAALVLIYSSPLLTVILLLFIPPSALLIVIASPHLRDRERCIRQSGSEWTSSVIEVLHNIRTIKAFANEATYFQRVEEPYKQLQVYLKESATISEIANTLSSLLVGVGALALLVVGTQSVLHGQLSVGTMLLFASVSGLVMGTVDHLSPTLRMIQEAGTRLSDYVKYTQ